MNKILLFNPDTEMAIADGSPSYTPPKNIAVMKKDLSLLPCWWGDSSDCIADGGGRYRLLPEESRELIGRYGCRHFTDPRSGTAFPEGYTALPWGWNPREVHFFQERGIRTPLWNEETKRQYGRESAVRLMEYLSEAPDLPQECRPQKNDLPVTAERMEDLEKILSERKWESCMMKRPWSSSGRGNRILRNAMSPADRQWIENAFRSQGSLVLEPLHEKIEDFAMEFQMQKGRCSFISYSIFTTGSGGGNYQSNRIAPDQELESSLACHTSLENLNSLREACLRACEQLFSRYEGCFGIDMMITPNGIVPCIEINFRMNMGILAAILNRRCRLHGRLHISCGQPAGNGDLLLTPAGSDTRFHAYVSQD